MDKTRKTKIEVGSSETQASPQNVPQVNENVRETDALVRKNERLPKDNSKKQWEELVLAEELRRLNVRQKKADAGKDIGQVLTGLCLSGGGIRSAVFCAGVLGELAKRGLLSKFDYLSTVSGGGYTGAALSYWLRKYKQKGRENCVNEVCPFKPSDQGQSKELSEAQKASVRYLRHLRANASYLMPTGFKGAVIGAYIVVRSIIINLFIWISLAAGFLSLLYWGIPKAFLWFRGIPDQSSVKEAASLSSVGVEKNLNFMSDFKCLAFQLYAKFCDALLVAISYGENSIFHGLAILGVFVVIIAAVQMFVFSLGTCFKPRNVKGYWWRKSNEWFGGFLVLIALVAIPIGLLPVIASEKLPLPSQTPEWLSSFPDMVGVGIGGTTFGSLISVIGLFRARLGGCSADIVGQ